MRSIKEENLYYPEICEEFRIRYNLYQENDGNYYRYDDYGQKDCVVKYSINKVEIKYKYLWEFIGVKQVCFAIFSDIERTFDEDFGYSPETYDLIEKGKSFIIDRYYPNWVEGYKKVIFKGKSYLFPINHDNIPELYEKKKYVSFLIGKNKLGKDVEFTCEPDRLANYFGANPDAPHYLTPIFFNKDVLKKYYDSHEKYEVEDGSIVCDYWILRIDNDCSGYVNVFLGDLGTNLPYNEQQYWRSFNIYVDDAKMSPTRIKRAFMGQFADSIDPAVLLKQKTTILIDKWEHKFKWRLILPLNDRDQYNFAGIRIPLNNNQKEFDEILLLISKIFNDSLNLKGLRDHISKESLSTSTKDQLEQSLFLFEVYLKEQSFGFAGDLCQLLRDIQLIRSTGIAHRKGSNYEKVMKRVGIDEKHLTVSIAEMFKKLIFYIEELNSHFELS